jgi:hypothetical protein
MPSAASGLILIDMVIRPFYKVAVKFPIAGFMVLMVIYGFIGYIVLKSAYLSES